MKDETSAQSHLRNILSSFMQYTQAPFNGFRVASKSLPRILRDYTFRVFVWHLGRKIILNTEELASIFHLPTKFNLTPNIKWLGAKQAPAPVNVPAKGLLLGINDYRGVKTEIRATREDRRRHMYIIGRTGTGKSEFLKNMAIQDMQNGEGLAVVDPHGDLIDELLIHVPENRAEDVVLFEPFDLDGAKYAGSLEPRGERFRGPGDDRNIL